MSNLLVNTRFGGNAVEVAKGLEGVIVDETRICKINKDDNLLYYFGYEIRDLTEHATYEEVFYLLTHGELPNPEALRDFNRGMESGCRSACPN